ncbi:putative metalloprotease CJM1_0395 family protein [Ferrovibrio sp. MS7]|uniref:putative metalloprotease CJM1_0395 family protein n=1 Tax=Ferrovibrio plantarum TaxID=3119164 RepID=UPI003136AB0D
MIGSLSLYSPATLPAFGAAPPALATAQSRANDGSAVCSALDCSEHGAFNRAQLAAQFPGLASARTESARQNGIGPGAVTAASTGTGSSGIGSSGTGRLASNTLLTAQEQATPAAGSGKAQSADQLSEEEKAQVAKLKAIDAKVRAHERAHAAVGGQYAGAPSYSYTRGPDGQMYATSGEVSIDISAENDPEATLQKAAQVAAAALAPADPSGADRAVAAAAQALRLEALAQIRAEKKAEQEAQQAEAGTAPAPNPAPGQSPAESPAARASAAYAALNGLIGRVAQQQGGALVNASA